MESSALEVRQEALRLRLAEKAQSETIPLSDDDIREILDYFMPKEVEVACPHCSDDITAEVRYQKVEVPFEYARPEDNFVLEISLGTDDEFVFARKSSSPETETSKESRSYRSGTKVHMIEDCGSNVYLRMSGENTVIAKGGEFPEVSPRGIPCTVDACPKCKTNIDFARDDLFTSQELENPPANDAEYATRVVTVTHGCGEKRRYKLEYTAIQRGPDEKGYVSILRTVPLITEPEAQSPAIAPAEKLAPPPEEAAARHPGAVHPLRITMFPVAPPTPPPAPATVDRPRQATRRLPPVVALPERPRGLKRPSVIAGISAAVVLAALAIISTSLRKESEGELPTTDARPVPAEITRRVAPKELDAGLPPGGIIICRIPKDPIVAGRYLLDCGGIEDFKLNVAAPARGNVPSAVLNASVQGTCPNDPEAKCIGEIELPDGGLPNFTEIKLKPLEAK